MAGYSSTPLLKKLGIKPGFSIHLFQPPDQYLHWLRPLPNQLLFKEKLSGEIDFIHVFVKDYKNFTAIFSKSKKYLKKDGMLWVSWPKKSSKILTDLDETRFVTLGYRKD